VAYEQINRSSLNSRTYSSQTLAVLHRYNFDRAVRRDPLSCIRELHAIACRDDRRDTLLALSELCFQQGRQGSHFKVDSQRIDPMNLYVASALYAYLYLLGPGAEPPPSPFDRQFRVACDIYNRSLALALLARNQQPKIDKLEIILPVGKIILTWGRNDLPWPIDAYDTFTPADDFLVRGLSVRNRSGGLGAPLVAALKRQSERPAGKANAATIFLRVDGGLRELAAGSCRGVVDLYSPLIRHEIVIDGKTVPIETDMTTQLAYVLENPALWSLGLTMFRLGQMPFPPGIYSPYPYEAGKIPVVLVHGTMSSPVWWAEMLNTLAADPQIREKFQFWLYLYDSGKPIVYSARNFQEALESHLKKCDPKGADPALTNLVVIGHSQGGLLTRLVSTDTGEAIIRGISGKTLQELKLSTEENALVQRYAVFKAMPQVSRVIFISTPHHGSFLAGSFARKLARYFIRLPQDVLKTGTDLLTITKRIKLPGTLSDNMPTSIDSMAPDNPLLLTIAKLPIPPAVTAHSIISVKPGMKAPDGDDGVVKYTSAHLEGVASEFVVPCEHSCQGNPLTIEEVRRILLEHLKAAGPAKAVVPDSGPKRAS
jgi:pimeloyl-ACP methyl ester carboxylesterase